MIYVCVNKSVGLILKILFADDHTLFREALVQYIGRADPDTEIIIARDIHEAIEKMESHEGIDLVLLDFKMPGMDGLEGMRKIRHEFPDIKVALLSGLAEKKDVDEALDMGAVGYFPKTLTGKALLNGLRDIVQHDKVFVAMDHNTNDIMPSYFNGGAHVTGKDSKAGVADMPDGSNLTRRESEVLSYLLAGASNKDIARALDLQVVTVKLHVRGVCRKLGAKNRTQAALIAQEMELVEPVKS